ncbi:hypothetical protein GCM10009530_63580 [Microbispora corallina]|uniref:Uncharacterized protein n=1 Tax=Microbispora corallina TaxID=83302 RepID=A0ABQ4GBH2_9ACTN|nr:hypothetical protein [Microbispora corallina]GIH44412.1 hypothetical protein Mco01_74120 [Microbispora corallina]
MDDLIAFLHARHDDARRAMLEAQDADEPGWYQAERDLQAKRARLKYLEFVLAGHHLAVEEHAQAEHLLRLEAAAYDWHPDYRSDEWLP